MTDSKHGRILSNPEAMTYRELAIACRQVRNSIPHDRMSVVAILTEAARRFDGMEVRLPPKRKRGRARFGKALRGYRERAGMESRELAKLMGVSPAYVCAVENGWKPPLTDKRIEALVTGGALDLSDDDGAELLRLASEARIRH